MEYDEEYDYQRRERGRRRPSPAPRVYTETRGSQQFLNPGNLNGIYRTRSQGHIPQPIVNVYTDVVQEGNMRNDPRTPSPAPYPAPYPVPYPVYGRRDRLGEELVSEFVDLAVENNRLRSRSRGRSDAEFYSPPRDDYYEREIRRLEREREMERERERLKQEYDNQRLKEDAKKKADEDARKEEKKRIVDEFKQKQSEEEAERKAEEKRIRDKIELEKIEAKEKEEREWNEFLRKQREKEAKDKADKEAKERELEEEMRKRLLANGYTLRQIEAMISEDKTKRKTTTTTTTIYNNNTNAVGLWQPGRAPVYAKVHRDFLSVETLRYYGVPWKYDETDSEYIIILREMDKYETDVLFEHTKKLRAGKLLIEPAKKEKQYAFFRKRSRSKSRTRRVGIIEYM